MSKTAINARIDSDMIKTLRAEASERGQTLTECLESLINEHQTMTGASAAERKIAALEARLAEQERIVKKHTGQPTPEKRRVGLTLPLAAAQELDAQAHRHGMSRSEFVAAIMDGARTGGGKALPIAQPQPPALT